MASLTVTNHDSTEREARSAAHGSTQHMRTVALEEHFSSQRFVDSAGIDLSGQVRCADSGFAPHQWYPVSIEPAHARHEAAAPIAVCTSCPVRAQCLELSLRHWDIVQHGVWGGLVATDRAHLHAGACPGHGLMGNVKSCYSHEEVRQ
jgi:hypothetical protein